MSDEDRHQFDGEATSCKMAYAPLREYLQRCGLAESLADVWQLARRADDEPVNGERLSAGVAGTGLLPWDMPTLAREVLLHAPPGGSQRLNTRDRLAPVASAIREVEELGDKVRLKANDGFNEVLFFDLLRKFHRQLPWQNRAHQYAMVRCFKIFAAPAMAPMLESKTNLTIREFVFLGMTLCGHLLSRFDINSDQDYQEFGISKERAMAFFERLTMDWRDLRRAVDSQGGADENWEFMWNPLEATPLILVHPAHPNRLYCPIPQLLFRRFSGGIYYDLIEEEGFSKAFGDAFEAFVGELLAVAFPAPKFQIQEERPYLVRKQQHRGPDWILGDTSGNLFIECKTKRLSQEAKSAGGDDKIREEIGTLADAIVQNYKNVIEALEGKSHWSKNTNPCWPLVITFEDWYLFGPVIHQVLADAVRVRLAAKRLDPGLVEKMPYSVMSCREFEIALGAISEAGISDFFSGKHQGDYGIWMWPQYQADRYPEARRVDLMQAFSADLKAIIPEADWRPATGGAS